MLFFGVFKNYKLIKGQDFCQFFLYKQEKSHV